MPEEHDKDPCVICNEQQAETIPSQFDGIHQNCPRCGEFKCTGTALGILSQGMGNDRRAKLSGWIREQYRGGDIPLITDTNLKSILDRPLPNLSERATNFLIEASYGMNRLGDRFNVNDPRFKAATYSSDDQEVQFFIQMLLERGYLEHLVSGGLCQISPDGYMQLDELNQQTNTSSQGFVAMWFHQDLNEVYANGFQTGIIQAGYDPIRIDQTEHVNRIDDEIIRQINSSKFIVADFTGHRGGVYFEAGYAMGKGIPIFWTCRRDNMNELHFDIRQFNCIDWQSQEELAERLSVRLEAVLGPGPNKA